MSTWLILIGLLILIINAPGIGFIVAGFYLLYRFSRKLPELVQQKPPDSQSRHISSGPDTGWATSPTQMMSIGTIADLMLLRRELEQLFESGTIDAGQRDHWFGLIDALSERYFADRGAVPGNSFWCKRRDAAWDLLNAYADEPLGRPPWTAFTPQAIEACGAVEWVMPLVDKPESKPYELPIVDDMPPTEALTKANEVVFNEDDNEPEVSLAGASDPFIQEVPLAAVSGQTVGYSGTDSSAPVIPSKPDTSGSDSENYAWRRHEPGRMEQVLKKLSGWHAMTVPFLVQNIGWFIGVFCFIAGSIFLVSYSTGYVKNLIVFLTLFIFTLFLLWGGYQIRSKRPELSTSSDVILWLGTLLIPLTTVTATRLALSSESLLLKIVSGLLLCIEFSAFYVAVMVVSALLDRSLQHRLPKFFLGLSFAQLLLPMPDWLPYWPVLALMHSVLFVMLTYSVMLFINEWLHSIFVDRHKIAYFAAGMLVYAAAVSFVHLTWGSEKNIDLPAGYYGPFLMMLCGLLFFVDGQFKQWVNQYASLSRFSFFIYGLSILTLFLAARQPPANIITLILAIALYGYVIWRYLTLIPLYIFLACACWLYYLVVLQFVPAPAHFLAAMPVFAALYAVAKWALRQRKSAHLAIIMYRVLYALAALITVWSLAHSDPGLLAMATAVSACALVYFSLRSVPLRLFAAPAQTSGAPDSECYHNLLNSRWFYIVTLLTAAIVYYSPLLPGLTRASQFALGLLLLSGFYGYRGLALLAQSFSTDPVLKLEIRFNSALLALLSAILLCFIVTPGMRGLLPAMAGAIALWFSLKLRVRWLFYLMLVLWGSAVAIIKSTYFPAPSNGLGAMVVAMLIWFLLRYLHGREQSDYSELEREYAEIKVKLLPVFELLWFYRVNAQQENRHDA